MAVWAFSSHPLDAGEAELFAMCGLRVPSRTEGPSRLLCPFVQRGPGQKGRSLQLTPVLAPPRWPHASLPPGGL